MKNRGMEIIDSDVLIILLLDMRGVDDARLPLGGKILELMKRRFSWDSGPIRIVPVCHYNMGGIIIDRFGRTPDPSAGRMKPKPLRSWN